MSSDDERRDPFTLPEHLVDARTVLNRLENDSTAADWLRAVRARAVVELTFAPGKDAVGLLRIVTELTERLDEIAPAKNDSVDETARKRAERQRRAG